MSEPTVTPEFEFFYNKPNKADAPAAEDSKKKLDNAFSILQQHPDFVGLALEAVNCDDATLALIVLEWTSSKGHERVLAWEKFPDFLKAMQGVWIGTRHIDDYHFSGPFLKPTPQVIEHLVLTLKPDVTYAAFLEPFSNAMRHVLTVPGCKGFVVGQQREDPTKALLLVGWEKLEDHTEGLAKSANYPAFQEEMGTVLETFVQGAWSGIQMSHFKTGGLGL